MELSKRTDLAFRTLIYLAVTDNKRVTIMDISKAYNAPKSHLMKVVNSLVHAGFFNAVRGKNGGISLAYPANKIALNSIIEAIEPTLTPIDCVKQKCAIDGHCKLPKILSNAQQAYLNELKKFTLTDIIAPTTAQTLQLPSIGIGVNL